MAKEKDIIIANHHTGPVTLPRTYLPNTDGNPASLKRTLEMVTIPSGETHCISATEYEIRKTSPGFQYYLDKGILTLVKRSGEVDVTNDAIIDTGLNAVADVAPHLLPDQEGNVTVASKVDGSPIKAGLRQVKKGSVTL